jgi:membrane protease subunit HflK
MKPGQIDFESDEIQKLLRKLGDQFGKFGGISILVVVLLIFAALSSFYTIDVSEEGVITRFGRYLKTAPPGLHYKLPFGVDRVYKVASKRRLQEEFGFRTSGVSQGRSTYEDRGYSNESLMLTGDLNVGDVSWILQYEISDPWKYLFHARDVQRNIRDVSLSIMRRVVGDRLVGEVLTVGRVEIADEAKRLTQEVLNRYDMGIRIVTVNLQDVNPPDPVKPAFNDVNAAKQQQEEAINVAEREYNRFVPEARGSADQLLSEAEAYSINVVNRAKGDASRFKAVSDEYQKAPDITRSRLYIEAMESIFSGIGKLTVVDERLQGVLPIFGANSFSQKKNTTTETVGER